MAGAEDPTTSFTCEGDPEKDIRAFHKYVKKILKPGVDLETIDWTISESCKISGPQVGTRRNSGKLTPYLKAKGSSTYQYLKPGDHIVCEPVASQYSDRLIFPRTSSTGTHWLSGPESVNDEYRSYDVRPINFYLHLYKDCKVIAAPRVEEQRDGTWKWTTDKKHKTIEAGGRIRMIGDGRAATMGEERKPARVDTFELTGKLNDKLIEYAVNEYTFKVLSAPPKIVLRDRLSTLESGDKSTPIPSHKRVTCKTYEDDPTATIVHRPTFTRSSDSSFILQDGATCNPTKMELSDVNDRLKKYDYGECNVNDNAFKALHIFKDGDKWSFTIGEHDPVTILEGAAIQCTYEDKTRSVPFTEKKWGSPNPGGKLKGMVAINDFLDAHRERGYKCEYTPPKSSSAVVSKRDILDDNDWNYDVHSVLSLAFDDVDHNHYDPLIRGEYNDVSGSGSPLFIGGVVGASSVIIIMVIFCLGLAFGMLIYLGYSQKRALERNWKEAMISDENVNEV
eukprot:517494_1